MYPTFAVPRLIGTSLTVAAALACAAFTPHPAAALTRDEVGALAFLVVHQDDRKVKAAWDLLVDRGVMVERPETQWELTYLYPRDREPEIAEALVTLQESKILSVKPINWKGSENAVEILIDKEEIFPRALDMMARATRTIRFNIFLWGGTIGRQTVDAMVAAKARGVDVQIITMPDLESSSGALKKLQSLSNKLAGETKEPIPLDPVKQLATERGLTIGYYPVEKLNGAALVKADHNKMLSIDGEEALIGGMNFADVIAGNHDLMLWIAGPAVRELEEVFADNWRLCRKEGEENQGASPLWNDDRILDLATTKRARELATVVVAYSSTFVNSTRSMVEQLIDGATSKIRIMMFTFVDDRVVEKVIAAKKRGVDVAVLLDPNVHAFGLRLMGAPNISTVRQLKAAGIPVRVYKTTPGNQMHIKAMMVDDRYSCFGSTNFTKAGFDSNNETFIRAESPYVARDFQALFDLDWEGNTYDLKTDGVGKWLLSTVAEAVDGTF